MNCDVPIRDFADIPIADIIQKTLAPLPILSRGENCLIGGNKSRVTEKHYREFELEPSV